MRLYLKEIITKNNLWLGYFAWQEVLSVSGDS